MVGCCRSSRWSGKGIQGVLNTVGVRKSVNGLAALVLAGLLLAACGDLPKPFQHAQSGQPLTRLETAELVTVMADPATPEAAPALVQSLLAAGVPARLATAADVGGYQVGPDLARGQWVLRNPEGVGLVHANNADGVAALSSAIKAAVEKDMESPLVLRMAAPAPDPIPGLRPAPDPRLKPPGSKDTGPPGLDTIPALSLGTIGGFGAKKDDILRGALETSLLRAGLKVSETARFVIDGDISQEVIGGITRLRVVWTVRDTQGQEVGTVSQENPVEAEFLDGQFPALAVAIADGGTEGVYAMLSRVRLDPASNDQ